MRYVDRCVQHMQKTGDIMFVKEKNKGEIHKKFLQDSILRTVVFRRDKRGDAPE